ncbi:phosphate:acyl-[acyl carrier protein] acyltransferase [Sporobacter termitidis DSM 10068]|uniref:Phosphate acyltransferase n=1 Tax=Sporobacter termitidis DSM 10068 TaxID=1123282 RepID=A0A1M5UL26_9FIRM|nr:phosphate acyltransferase PlsX [Sporobacter termitidis]SHH63647.1 phosphate:acyl-[acyl carrier protein] acyltransferase [Sporobacter termitidis DSM 10068]
MKIIIDAMGGDNAPDEIVKGAIEAAEAFNIEIILTGKGEEILRSVQKMGRTELPKGIEIAHADQVIAMDEDPVTAIREKKDSSMLVGLNMLRDGLGDAMVSAGSTGALLSGATLVVKRIRGIRRAAMAPVLPVGDKGIVLIDCGANAECTPEYLLQFAFMGSFYAEHVLKIKKPRVGLLNIGTESIKGTDLQIEAYRLLEEASKDGALNFVGNVESKGVMYGECDVLVADGYTGNILLKSIEGTASFLLREIKGVFMKNAVTKLAALLVKKHVRSLRERMDADKVGGTALLGISKPVIKAHGSSGAAALKNAVLQAMTTVDAHIAEEIQSNIERMKIEEKAEKN